MDSPIEVSCLDDLVKFANTARQKFGYDPLWFRGHRNESWKLWPEVFRDRTKSEATIYELRLLRKFRARAPRRHHECPDGGDYFAWLSLMRHYGLPTRLLDWSESLLIAAYFAVEPEPKPVNEPEKEDSPGAIWALDPTRLSQKYTKDQPAADFEPTFAPSLSPAHLYASNAFRGKVIEDTKAPVIPVFPRETSLRMQVQRAAFTIHAGIHPLEETAPSDCLLLAATIPAEAKDKLRSDLAALGIDRAALFPDLEWMSKGLAESELPATPGNP